VHLLARNTKAQENWDEDDKHYGKEGEETARIKKTRTY
jgi:hypothetical protein